jgi:signal transduction histidine kinase
MSNPSGGRDTEGIDVLAVGDPLAGRPLDASDIRVTNEPRPDEGRTRIESSTFDCVLSGTELGEQTVSEVFASVREHDDMIPFVVVTGESRDGIESVEGDVTEIIVRDTLPEGRETAYIANRLRRAVATSRQLRQCERELEQRIDRLEEFTTVISHDLRNPLNVARSTVELLEGDREHLDRLDRSLRRIDATIERGVTFARQDSTVEQTAPADLETFATDVWADLNPGDATLHADTDGPIVANPDRLRELLRQLLDNAVEHGEPPVTVETFEGGFSVADTGPGVPERVSQRAFEPGVSTTQGTGLGLAIVREIARAHGWEVSLTESESGGARIEVTGVEFC